MTVAREQDRITPSVFVEGGDEKSGIVARAILKSGGDGLRHSVGLFRWIYNTHPVRLIRFFVLLPFTSMADGNNGKGRGAGSYRAQILDSDPADSVPAILSDDKSKDRATEEREQAWRGLLGDRYETAAYGTEGRIMIRSFTLEPGYRRLISFIVPVRRPYIGYSILSNVPINAYIIEEKDVNDFIDNNKIISSLKHEGRSHYENEMRFPYNGNWFMVVENKSRRKNAIIQYNFYGW